MQTALQLPLPILSYQVHRRPAPVERVAGEGHHADAHEGLEGDGPIREREEERKSE